MKRNEHADQNKEASKHIRLFAKYLHAKGKLQKQLKKRAIGNKEGEPRQHGEKKKAYLVHDTCISRPWYTQHKTKLNHEARKTQRQRIRDDTYQ